MVCTSDTCINMRNSLLYDITGMAALVSKHFQWEFVARPDIFDGHSY